MKYSIDGGATWVQSDSVRIVYDDMGDDDEPRELHIHVTHEGLVYDITDEGEVVHSQSATAQEITDSITNGD